MKRISGGSFEKSVNFGPRISATSVVGIFFVGALLVGTLVIEFVGLICGGGAEENELPFAFDMVSYCNLF
jgi:hypothetical protein